MNLYQKNLEVLKKFLNKGYEEDFLERLQKEEKEWEEYDVVYGENEREEVIYGVKGQQHTYMFNSSYNAEKMVKIWVDDCDGHGYEGGYIVFGLGDGRYLSELKERYPKAALIIYEPSWDMFRILMHNLDLSWIFEKDLCFLAVGKDGMGVFLTAMESYLSLSNIDNTDLLLTPNYEKVYRKEWLQAQVYFGNTKRNVIMCKNTDLEFADSYRKNSMNNYFDAIRQCTVYDMFLNIEKEGWNNYPAILVSAGPSLDKNVHELKHAKGKAFIIAVDTALKTLLKAGIMPDLAVSIAMEKPMNLFQREEIVHIPMVIPVCATSALVEMHRGRRFYFTNFDTFAKAIYRKRRTEIPPLGTGGSVANSAYSVAVFLGFKRIILIGQDLAFTNDRLHTDVAYEAGEVDPLGQTLKNKFLVEAYGGGQVYTEPSLDMYRKWFERNILLGEQVKVINATEGGSRIRGTEEITLCEAIHRECTGEIRDFRACIERTPPTFDKEMQSKILEELKQMPEILEGIGHELEDIIKDYDRLETLNKAQKRDMKKVRNQLEIIRKKEVRLEEKPELSLLVDYVTEQETDNIIKAYEGISNDVVQETSILVEKGRKLHQLYFNAVPPVQEEWREVIERNVANIEA